MEVNVLESIPGIGAVAIGRIRISYYGYLSMGFGKMIPHGNPRLRDDSYGEWEIGCFHRNWKVMREEGGTLCGETARDGRGDAENWLWDRLRESRIIGISSDADERVHVVFTAGFRLVFEDGKDEADAGDEIFHVFCPGGMVWDFVPGTGWNSQPGVIGRGAAGGTEGG